MTVRESSEMRVHKRTKCEQEDEWMTNRPTNQRFGNEESWPLSSTGSASLQCILSHCETVLSHEFYRGWHDKLLKMQRCKMLEICGWHTHQQKPNSLFYLSGQVETLKNLIKSSIESLLIWAAASDQAASSFSGYNHDIFSPWWAQWPQRPCWSLTTQSPE